MKEYSERTRGLVDVYIALRRKKDNDGLKELYVREVASHDNSLQNLKYLHKQHTLHHNIKTTQKKPHQIIPQTQHNDSITHQKNIY